MTGKERIFKAFKCEEPDHAPWVPFVGCHGGKLIGVSADEFLKSKELIVQGQSAAVDRYHPDGIPVVFDLQVEAEVLGCDLAWSKDNPPAVVSHPLKDGKTLEELTIPSADQGRIKTCLDAARELRARYKDIALYGLITGPFTLTLHLAGTDLFMKMYDDPGYIKTVMFFARDVCCRMAEYYIEAGCDIVAVVDPMTSQIGPDDFRRFVKPYAHKVFDKIRESGALSSFFVCGHAQQNVGAMCECGPDNISVDENIPLDFVKNICLDQGVSFGGNMQLTSVLLLGTPQDAQKNAVACLEVAGERGFILAPGCDLPYATPPENLEAVSSVVSDKYARDIIKTMATSEVSEELLLDMSQYGETDKVIVDVITLDSESCAPCQYMVESVKAVAPEFAGIVEWREHSIKYRENLTFMTSLMVRNIPTICIDGQITFVSQIPPRPKLIEAIQARINEKLRVRIQKKRAVLYLLSGEKEDLDAQVTENIKRAVEELGADVEVNTVVEKKHIRSFGVYQTPAIVLERRYIKSVGTVPSVDVIKEWIKDI